MNGKCVEEFVGKVDASEGGECLERWKPAQFFAWKLAESLDLGGAERNGRLDDLILGDAVAGGKKELECGEKIVGEVPAVGSLFDDRERSRSFEFFPEFGKLRGEKGAEEWADADAGKEVASAPDLGFARGIVTVVGVIKSDVDKLAKRD